MKITKILLSAAIISTITIASVSTAYAWHPKGEITKKVQNITAGSALSEADTEKEAVAAKPGDTLKYVITVRNSGEPSSNGYNDMAKIVMKDTLPTGVELASAPSQRQITESYNLLKPGEAKTWEYLVKVTATKNGAIPNTACFTGNSTANDNHQEGCNPAIVTVTVPIKPEEPVITTPKPQPPTPKPAPQMPVELPKTGTTENILGSAFVLGLAWYVAHRYITSRRELAATQS